MTREQRVPLEALRRLSPVVVEAGGAIVMRFPEAPDSPMLNRVVGLGVHDPATPDDVDAVLEALAPARSSYVALAEEARPPELDAWLAERGLEPGWGWMTFRRGVEALPSDTGLRVVEADDEADVAACARIVRTSFDLPEAVESALAKGLGNGWRCWLALDGEVPAAAGGLFVSDGAGYLGFAATGSEHRGKGAQRALLAARIRRAAELGCDVVLAETGERREGLPDASYRNLLRAGFEEIGVTANWLRRAG